MPPKFFYLTCHREENTHRDKELREILTAMESLDFPTVYPVHPRNRKRVLDLQKEMHLKQVILIEPVGYLQSIALVQNAQKVVTDSGGLQREAFFATKKCVTVLPFVVWPETMTNNRNNLAMPKATDIITKLNLEQKIDPEYHPFGDGHSAEKILKALEEAS